MNFLKRLLSTLTGSFHASLGQSDPLARFSVSRRMFIRARGEVKASAFLPRFDPGTNEWATSVFRIGGLSEQAIRTLQARHVPAPKGRTMYGRAEILTSIVKRHGLDVKLDNAPPRHTDIVSWPDSKPEQKSVAQQLAADATLRLTA